MSQTLSLFRLQQTDTQMDHCQARLKTIQGKLENDEDLRRATRKADELEKERLAVERALDLSEKAVQVQHIKIEQTEANLYSGSSHNPKELQELQEEITSLKRFHSTLEDHLLETMMTLEKAENNLRTSLEELHDIQTTCTEQNSILNQEKFNLLKEIETLGAERQAIVISIPVDDIILYESLRQQRRGVAVASIAENTCTACGVGLTPSQIQNARSATPMARCPSCGRILYCS